MRVKSAKTVLFASLIAAMILPFSAIGFAEAEQVTEKTSVRNSIEAKMQEQVRKDQDATKKYTSNEYGIPYGLIFEENGKLIIGINGEKTREFQESYSIDEVKSDLQTTLDVEVKYFALQPEVDVRAGEGLKNHATNNVATITLVQNDKIITTGHAFGVGDVLIGNSNGSPHCREVKITHNPSTYPQYADAAYGIDLYNVNCDNNYINNSITYKGKNYSVTDGQTSDITKGKKFYMAGIVTQSSGNILDADATIRNEHGILHDQVIAQYNSAKGDSGAPIFSITGANSAKILGQHVGKVCFADLNSNMNLIDWCNVSGIGFGNLKVFSPWPAVKSNLGI